MLDVKALKGKNTSPKTSGPKLQGHLFPSVAKDTEYILHFCQALLLLLGIEKEIINKKSRKVHYLLCNDAVNTIFPSKWQTAFFQDFMDIALCLTRNKCQFLKNSNTFMKITAVAI